MSSADRIGSTLFTNGAERAVYEADHGQFVMGDDGERVRGVWLLADESVTASGLEHET